MTFNDKPFDPKDFEETMLRALREVAAAHVQAAIGAVRDPVTGEFPTVVTSVDEGGAISVRAEGTPEILSVVGSRLAERDEGGSEAQRGKVQPTVPKVFLSYAWENRELAERIALSLMDAGIDTWWAEWAINAGDSLPQKINEGLGDCTHFLVLLTPESIQKPWVQHEMDAGLIRRISAQTKFIPLRHQLPAQELPPLLRPMLSPEINDVPGDIRQLINDIHGISRKPSMGQPPLIQNVSLHEDYSAAANAVAKVFVENSVNALFADP